jgi:hypothetical protein
MAQLLYKFIREGGWFLLLIGILYAGGWHTEVLGFVQRGMLYTSLFSPTGKEAAVYPSPDMDSLLLYDEKGAAVHGKDLAGELVLLNV